MTNTVPRRLTILQCTQIFLTEALAFILVAHLWTLIIPQILTNSLQIFTNHSCQFVASFAYIRKQLFIAEDNPAFGKIIWAHFKSHAIPRQKTDIMHAHPTGNMSQHFVSIIETNTKRRAWQRFQNLAFYPDQFFVVGHSSLAHQLHKIRIKFPRIKPNSCHSSYIRVYSRTLAMKKERQELMGAINPRSCSSAVAQPSLILSLQFFKT